jgi:hypothetical protein
MHFYFVPFVLFETKGSLCYVKAQVLCNLLTFYMDISGLLDCLHGSCLRQMKEKVVKFVLEFICLWGFFHKKERRYYL